MAKLEDDVQKADTWMREHRTLAAGIAGLIVGIIIGASFMWMVM